MSNKKINYDFNLINKAFNIASEKHQNQTRKGSDIPYLIHLMDVASILFQFKASTDQVCAGFLHDTIEDTPYTLEELKEDFNINKKYTLDLGNDIHHRIYDNFLLNIPNSIDNNIDENELGYLSEEY